MGAGAEEGLEALWNSYKSRTRRLFSAKALTELTLRASFDLDLLVADRIANTVPPGTVPDCEHCENICCAGVENVVSLRLKDIAVLIDAGRTDLMSKKKPRFPRAMVERRPQLLELIHSELFRTLPVLRQVGEQRICAALSPNLRCTLHPHWPTSCERFPYSLSHARKQVLWGSRCQSKKSDRELVPRSRELFEGAVRAYNERVKDAVLLAHARTELEKLGIGAFLTKKGEDPFEPLSGPEPLPILG